MRLFKFAPLFLLTTACGGDPDPGTGPESQAGVETWSMADSPVVLTETHTVAAGQRLVIEPGVTVQLGAEIDLVIQGELIAQGTEAEPIMFTAQNPSENWGSVIFEDTAVSATFEQVDDYVAGSIIEHAHFELGTRAVQLFGASPYIHQNVFRDNTIPADVDPDGGTAIRILDGSRSRIRDNLFEDNTAELFAFGGAIFSKGADPILQDNTFLNNSSSYGGAVSTEIMASPIVGNTFEGNSSLSEGGGMSVITTISAIANNRFTGNHAAKDGGGLHICVTCYPHSAPFVMDNTIAFNTSDDEDATEGAAGFGAAFVKAFVDNNVHDNLRAGEPSDFGWFHELDEGYDTWASHPSIAGNWWGTTDPTAIDEAVFDGVDFSPLGIVTWDPPLTEAVTAATPRVTVSARKLKYVDAGDDLSVFLTVYNPGPERSVHLSIVHTEGAVDAAWLGALEFPGATQNGDGWDITMPENSVFFQQIESETYSGNDGTNGGFWRSTLSDDGTTIGVESVARYDFTP